MAPAARHIALTPSDHVEAAEAAYRKRRTIENSCTNAEVVAAYAEAKKLGYLT